jgi:hypothetical protein
MTSSEKEMGQVEKGRKGEGGGRRKGKGWERREEGKERK